MNGIIIREIQKRDNPEIAAIVRTVLMEMGAPKVGTAYADPQLDFMYETYVAPKSVYFVVETNGKIIGGAGISQLENEAETICELQKMYFLPEARGHGVGAKMIEKCLQNALDFGFSKCYLETMPYMVDAQKLYKKVGFEYLCAPLGNTGHTSCPVWMIKELGL
ncbi:GNAT family N-acetyltransferase [Flavobacterium psychrotolerans]|uniref:GNAT family N-acetyltransferase n=1 Tax=Flavobacterium psychrotolerans TaxID=2169410 RepID=A0A2U1JGC2_9FLAO|nr:GNAT family N-acetyltransferase [Flavobacterium psychrotolerans]PWA04196.1 GNAT family N-acetyltransferase [Flavobacterium psychrotolerans]